MEEIAHLHSRFAMNCQAIQKSAVLVASPLALMLKEQTANSSR